MARDRGQGNAAVRFSGFAELYDAVRPTPPPELGELIASYCGRPPRLAVDLGSGTGLSSLWASGFALEVVGVEPSDDMRRFAARRSSRRVRFRRGVAHDTGLPSACADVVLAVQALHWMEPSATFAEVGRLLRPGGVFAAVDCDFPPVVGDAAVERAWDDCRRRFRVLEARVARGVSGPALLAGVEPKEWASRSSTDASFGGGRDAGRAPGQEDEEEDGRELTDRVRRWSKSGHLARMVASGVFGYCRELALMATERGDATRFVELLRSQGDYQALARHGLRDEDLGLDAFRALVNARLGPSERPFRFVYRVRLGIKA